MHVTVHDAESLLVARDVARLHRAKDTIPNFVVVNHFIVGFCLFLSEFSARVMEGTHLPTEFHDEIFVLVKFDCETLSHSSRISRHDVNTVEIGGNDTRLNEGTRKSTRVLSDKVDELPFLISEFVHFNAIEVVDLLSLDITFLSVL